MRNINSIKLAVDIIKDGGVILYPTESVFGLGCDPFNQQAVDKLLAIKQRSRDKGLILIAAKWQHFSSLIKKIPEIRWQTVKSMGDSTWLFPKTEKVPLWIHGTFDSVAVRVTQHPLAKKLCEQLGHPLVSTSANVMGEVPAKKIDTLSPSLLKQVDYMLTGETGSLAQPTQIIDALTGKILR